MQIKNLTYEQWEINHISSHEDKWCRELYPFHVFSKIDFDIEKINVEQRIRFNQITYYISIKKIELQANERYKSTFDLSTIPNTNYQAWKYRTWNSTFQIVYSESFDFITVFTKKIDPSKEFVVRFMKGNFLKINEYKSIPISELLFRTLLLHLAEEKFPFGQNNYKFITNPNGIRQLAEHPQFKRKKGEFAPIYSLNRDVWVCYSFTEEKAHRIAYHVANQCKELIVVYCNPTYTRHHRCKYENTLIISLYEFSDMASSDVWINYENQVRFLQNHLNLLEEYDEDNLLDEITNPKQNEYIIQKSELMEALGIMRIKPLDDLDLFHSLSAINLINAFLSRERKNKTLNSKEKNLFRNMYFFKTYLSDILSERIVQKKFSIPIYIEDSLIIIKIFNFEFSFHNVPLNDILQDYESSSINKEILWNGKRLQPIAPLLLKYSRTLRNKKNYS